MKKLGYTTEGNVRSDCGHTHRTLKTAYECLRKDERGCRKQGGYSDRKVVRVMLENNDVIRTYPLTETEWDTLSEIDFDRFRGGAEYINIGDERS